MANILDQITIGDMLIMTVDADPSASAGTVAAVNSLAFFGGVHYIKTGAGDTAWTVIPSVVTDLTAYLKLLGRVGGQTAIGGTASGDNLAFQSTSNATKGKITFGSGMVFDEANTRFGLGFTTPLFDFDLTKSGATYAFQQASATTSNATPTSIGSIATIADNTMLLKVYIVGDTSTNTSVTYEKTARVVNSAGTVTISTISSDYTSEASALAAASATIVASGANVSAQVTGIAATTIDWKVTFVIIR
jgi:hypothetical protein